MEDFHSIKMLKGGQNGTKDYQNETAYPKSE